MNCNWGKHELIFLRDNYKLRGPEYCANSLARTISAVQRQAHRLKLTNPERGFSVHKKSILYFISFEYKEQLYYKIGITNKESVKDRFGSDWKKFNCNLLWSIESQNGQEIKDLEKKILIENAGFLLNTGALGSGNTETLTVFINKPKEL
jgi:hypothetical protein